MARADGVAGAQHHAALDAVAEERRPVVGEEVLLVAPELEEGERVVAVAAHELADRLPHLRVGQRPRSGERPEHEPGRGAERDEPEQPDREREVPALVAEVQPARLPREQLERLVDQLDKPACGAAIATAATPTTIVASRERRHAPGGRAKPHRVAPHVERVAPPPEQRRPAAERAASSTSRPLTMSRTARPQSRTSATCHATRRRRRR